MTANVIVSLICDAFDEGDAAGVRTWAEQLQAHIANGRGRPHGMGHNAALNFATSAVTFARTLERIARDEFDAQAESLVN